MRHFGWFSNWIFLIIFNALESNLGFVSFEEIGCAKNEKNGFWHFSCHRFLRYGGMALVEDSFSPFFLSFGVLSLGFLVSMTGARYGIAFLWFRYILWWKLHFMVHWFPCSSSICSKHPFLSSVQPTEQENWERAKDAPNHVSIDTSMHKITWRGCQCFLGHEAF